MVGVRLPTHNTLKTNKMVKEKQLKELFKYIEANWDVCVEDVDKRDIKRIFGGVLCEDIMNDTLHEVKEPELNPIAEAYERGKKIRCKQWRIGQWIKKHTETQSIDEKGYFLKNDAFDFDFAKYPNDWELHPEPAEQSAPFDKERFEAMFRAVVAGGQHIDDLMATENTIKLLDAYYAEKEKGGNNE